MNSNNTPSQISNKNDEDARIRREIIADITRMAAEGTRRTLLAKSQDQLDLAKHAEARLAAMPRWRWLARAMLRREADEHRDAAARWLEHHDQIIG